MIILSDLNLDTTVFACGSPIMGENTATLKSDLYANCMYDNRQVIV